ncbi:MATE family efflux transporter [Halovenus sp. WSH3]|uniref:Multidrug-efflux transporter n=1 Tax=Halovenus carboxidivorans TaxID=2692199 RepID=A0A6B0T7V8_9EURY|nr:MATE family efflux transporter [Halovenus carboxidivorans]MXR53027.1 MATE family efflux transporter [Halovenus carboxidivorans]
MVEQVSRTLMRTTDVFVTALFSPLAVAAVGLADLYARIPLRIGLGLGAGAIALSSQDTSSGATELRDEAITQALVIGVLTGLPMVAFGLTLGEEAIGILGVLTEDENMADVASLGGSYLAIIFATSPARHVALIGARALQGTGDTRTPMYVNLVSNGLNIGLSLILGLGLFGAPRLEIIGVGLATAIGNVFTATVFLGLLATGYTSAGYVRPQRFVIVKQLLVVSAPKVAEGLFTTIVEFPFNALLLAFGTEVNAAYQIGRRIYQQVTSPLSRGFRTGASIVVGQALGDGDADRARFEGWATALLGLMTVGTSGLVLAVFADPIVRLFTDDPATIGPAIGFAAVYGLTAPFTVLFVLLAGALQGGSDTMTPLVARTTGLLGFYLGLSYVTAVVLGWGVVGFYVGIFGYYTWSFLVVAVGFRYGGWADRATAMMDERGSTGLES